MANFNEDAINTVFDEIVSLALQSGYFEHVNQHEPKSAPGSSGITCSVWIQTLRPIPSSGLSITSGLMILNVRMYTSMTSQPFDAIDPNVTAATSYMMGALSANFQLGGQVGVRAIDLLGAFGIPMAAQAGYVEIDRRMFRVMTLTVPVEVNDMWVQAP